MYTESEMEYIITKRCTAAYYLQEYVCVDDYDEAIIQHMLINYTIKTLTVDQMSRLRIMIQLGYKYEPYHSGDVDPGILLTIW